MVQKLRVCRNYAVCVTTSQNQDTQQSRSVTVFVSKHSKALQDLKIQQQGKIEDVQD